MKKNKICKYCKKEFNNYTNNNTATCSNYCRFMNFIEIKSDTDCWIWKRTTKNMSIFTINKKEYTTKSASYFLYHGKKHANNSYLRAICNEINCLNPKHLVENAYENYLINRKCTQCKNILTEQNVYKKSSLKLKFYARCINCMLKVESKRRTKIISSNKCIVCNKNNYVPGKRTLRTCSERCRFKLQYKEEQNGCFIWTRPQTALNIPKFYIGSINKQILVQKYAYWLKNSEHYSLESFAHRKSISTENTCGNTLCVNPDHIVLIKPSIKSAKKQSKLNYNQIQELKKKYEEDRWSYNDLSKHFNLSKQRISKIIKGLSAIQPATKSTIEIESYDTCINCSKQHDNLGTQYCSNECMQKYLLK